jgi:hypothetical protein
METIKQIIYRNIDGVLMIISDNVDFPITPRFYSELSTENKTIVDNLKTFSLTKVADIKYMVYTTEGDILDLESNQEENVRVLRADLEGDKPTLDCFIAMCETLLNS